MTKSEENKQKKRNALLNSAYHLFLNKGYKRTSIDEIARGADVAKGTFYLYFQDKDDIRHELIMRQSLQMLNDAVDDLYRDPRYNDMPFVDRIIHITDYIITFLAHDISQLQFLSKYLSNGMLTEPRNSETENETAIKFHDFIRDALQRDHIQMERANLVVFTILELVNSTCHNVILNGEPVTLGEYKPYLYRCIRVIIEDAISTRAGGTL